MLKEVRRGPCLLAFPFNTDIMIAIFVSLHIKDSVLTCLCPTLTSPVGNTDIYSPPNQDFGVSSIETHPDYRADDLCNDLVIIEPSFQCSVVLQELSCNLLRKMNCCRGRFDDKSWLLQALVTLVGSVDTAQVNIGLSCLPNQSDTYVYMSTTWRKNNEYLQIWSIYMIM